MVGSTVPPYQREVVKRVSLSGTCWSQNGKGLILAAKENSGKVFGDLQ